MAIVGLPRTGTLLVALALAATLAVGCASRKKVTTGQIEEPPPPPPPTETPQQSETPPPPPPREEESRQSLMDAFFDFDEAALREDAKSALEGNGKILQRGTAMNIVIEGHCDERGSVEYNLALGERRARAAKEFLVSYGVDAKRITTISYGKERPFDTGHDEDSWAKNRRAHFVER